jgi:hypothetical protein
VDAPRPEIPPDLKHRFSLKGRQHSAGPDLLGKGIAGVSLTGIPRGTLTEISGANSSGKTSFMLSALAQATADNEYAGLIDLADAFDPESAVSSGVLLDRLLWVRCSSRLEVALKASDILLQGGGYGLTVLSLGTFSQEMLRKIPMMYWFRFRRAVANTPAAFMVVSPVHMTGSCASLAIHTESRSAHWIGTREFLVLRGMDFHLKPSRATGTILSKGISATNHARIGRAFIASA